MRPLVKCANLTTLVIAAARADRSSFGCEDRRPWTYFWGAYFNHALREKQTFRDAFARARRLIALWCPAARNMDPRSESNPDPSIA